MQIFSEYLVEDRANYVKEERKRIEDVVKRLAPQFDTFESFEKAALGIIDNFNPNFFDLRWGYDTYNPGRQEIHRQGWENYAKLRADQDPSVVSRDRRGNVWTGD